MFNRELKERVLELERELKLVKGTLSAVRGVTTQMNKDAKHQHYEVTQLKVRVGAVEVHTDMAVPKNIMQRFLTWLG